MLPAVTPPEHERVDEPVRETQIDPFEGGHMTYPHHNVAPAEAVGSTMLIGSAGSAG